MVVISSHRSKAMNPYIGYVLVIFGVVQSWGDLGPDGCEEGWVHYNNFCYYFVDGRVHFDSAKSICALKMSALVSLWKQEEINFVRENLKQFGPGEVWAWIGAIPTKNNKWMWVDGSFFDIFNAAIPPATSDVCASMSTDGKISFIDCEETVQAFVCKKSLDMLYVPRSINITEDLVELEDDQSATVFERLWPPTLNLISLEETHNYHLATVDVSQETDCAYRCYTIDECKAFLVTCKATRKCNVFHCTLLSNVQHLKNN